MADGTEKMIAKIKKGDKVKSQVGESTVLEVLVHTGSFDVYSINDNKPFVTEEHPFKIYLATVKSPKSVALPVEAMVI